MYKLLATLLLTFTFMAPAFSDDLKDAKQAVKHQNYQTAYALYKPLAEQGEVEAQYALGEMYSKGLGAEQDLKAATQWYELAAEQGHLLAQLQAGRIYFLITEDLVNAHKWLNIISERKIDDAKKLQLMAAEMRNDIAKEMTQEQLQEAQKLAKIWLAKQ
ncbi:tetratricopeptide repeat protein [Kiloniella antarctica]|uniref:Tetratricopeptide repeat protein n=1 Tax=Kiloniella antarctica TaxID=1550907 RepID=A0ABW5BHK3_9PROT